MLRRNYEGQMEMGKKGKKEGIKEGRQERKEERRERKDGKKGKEKRLRGQEFKGRSDLLRRN